MKINENIRKQIKLTQGDLAMILGVSRGHLANYEIGLRDLSAKTLVALSQIERFFLSDKATESKEFEKAEVLNQKKKDFLENTLKENGLKQLSCERKMERMKANYDTAIKQLQLIDFLNDKTDNKDALHPGALSLLQEKAAKAFDKNGPLKLLQLELEQKMLQHEEQLLQSLLKKE